MSYKHTTTTHNTEQTQVLASRIGKVLKGGEVIELISDVGGGKTTFVRGLVQGAGSADAVASPTFTISRVYECANMAVAHFDFYRLDEPGIIRYELAEYLNDSKIVTVVEWPDSMQNVLPSERIQIYITTDGEYERTFTCVIPEAYSYVKDAVTT